MKCHGQEMKLGDDLLWWCPHCGREKYAWRAAYNELKEVLKNGGSRNPEDYVPWARQWIPKILKKLGKIEELTPSRKEGR